MDTRTEYWLWLFSQKFLHSTFPHERIIKWTQHIRFITLAEMERVVEQNQGNDLKEG